MSRGAIGTWVEDWLSAPRFGVYLHAVNHDRQVALKLYEWNAAISAAFQHDLAHLEVSLRNAYDRALTAAIPDGHPHWVFDPLCFFPPHLQKAANGVRYDANETVRRKIAAAVREAASPGLGRQASTRTGQPAPGKVIAELSFGFWRYLSAKRHDKRLWVPHLHKAFRPGVSRRAVDGPVGRLHKLRNRVAHHEPLLATDLKQCCQDVLTVAHLISDELCEHIQIHSSCATMIDQRPR